MQLNENIAELMGILTGDGFINYYSKNRAYVIDISGNKAKDFDYHKNFIGLLVEELFNFKPKIYFVNNQKAIRTRICSKDIFNSVKEYGFPIGRKEEISIPSWITNNKLFFRRFIRGVFDTDGCLCLKQKEGKKYPVISISSKSKSLLILIKSFLECCKISSYLDKYDSKIEMRTYKKDWNVYKLQINGKKNISLFFDIIGSKNQRNLIKYQEFLNL